MESGGERRRARRQALLALALHSAVAALLLAGAYRNLENLGGTDWNAFLGQAQAEATTLLDHGQFPAWNPWRRGGQVSFAQPESLFLSPVTALALLFGANAAFKLVLLPLFVIAAMGMRALAGDLGLSGLARTLTGAVFIAASVLPQYVNNGLPNWLFGMAILPWLLLCSRRAAHGRRWLVAGAALYAALLFCGSVHHFVFFPLLLALEAGTRAAQERRLRPLLATGALGLVGLSLSAVRLVPLLELFSEFPRRLDASNRFMPLSLLPSVLLWPHPERYDFDQRVFVVEGSVLDWGECAAFVGPVVALLAVGGTLLAWRRAWPFALLGGACVWISLGSGVRFSPWDAVHRLPVYESMQSPERFLGFGVFAIALLSGFGVERILAWLARRGRAALAAGEWLAALAVLLPLLVVNAPITRGAFPVPPPEGVAPSTLFARAAARPPFEQRRFPPITRQCGGPLYEAVLRNAGNVDGHSDVPSRTAARAAGELLYRGEVFLAGGHGEVLPEITPNRVRVRARLDAPDELLLNQNWFPGWRRSDTGEPCVARDGLVAVALPAGSHEFELVYAPRALSAGAILTLLALLAVVVWKRARRGVPEGSRESARVDVLALLLHALLVGGAVGWFATRRPAGAGAPPPSWREVAVTVAPSGGSGELQRAIDAAKPGDTIRLLPGEHGAATVRRGLTLVADPLGSASLASLTISHLPEGERVTAAGLAAASAPPPAPFPLRVERCAGLVVISDLGTAGPAPPSGARDPPRPRVEAAIESSPQVLFFGAGRLAPVTMRGSLAAFVRCSFAGAIDAAESVVLMNSCSFDALASGPAPAFVLRLRDRSRATTSRTPDLVVDPDSGSVRIDLDERPLALFLAGLSGSDAVPTLEIRGPPRARGTLVVGPRPALLPLRGAFAGQHLGVDFDGRHVLFPLELDAAGRLSVRVPPLGDPLVPGDGLYAQAWLPDSDDPRSRLYSLPDGFLLFPPERPSR